MSPAVTAPDTRRAVAPVIAPVTIRPPVINAFEPTFKVLVPVIGPDTKRLEVPVIGPDTKRLEVTIELFGKPFVSNTPLDQMSPPVTAPDTRNAVAPVIAPVTIRPPLTNAFAPTFKVLVPVIGPDTKRLEVTTRLLGIEATPFVSNTPLDQMSPAVTAPDTRRAVAPVIAPVTIRPPVINAFAPTFKVLVPVIGPETSKLEVTTKEAGEV